MTSRDPDGLQAASRAPGGLSRRALGGMLWTLSGTGVQAVAQLIATMALGRLLTPREFGLMGAAAVVVALSQIVSQIGVGPAIIQRRTLGITHVRVAITLSISLGLLLGLMVWSGAPAIARFYRMPEVEPVLRVLACLFALDGLSTVAKSILTRELRFRLFAALELGSYVLGFAVVAVLLAWLGYGVWALVLAHVAQVALRAIAMYVAVRHPLRPSFDMQAARDLLGFGFGHSVAQIGTVLSQQGDNLVVGRWLGAEALGIYGRAYNLMVMPASAFGRVVNRVLFPVMAQVQDERKRLAAGYERALAIVALVSLPISSFLWVVAPEFIRVVLGPGWDAVVLPFRLFTISLLFRMSSRISDACTKAAGAVYVRAVIQWLYAVLVIVGAVAGQRWGVGGVAVGVSIAMAINWLNMAWLGRSVTAMSWGRFARAHTPGILLAGLIGVAIAPVAQIGREAHLGTLVILLATGITAVVIVVIVATLRPASFLGQHGVSAWRQGLELLARRRAHGLTSKAGDRSSLASAGEVDSK